MRPGLLLTALLVLLAGCSETPAPEAQSAPDVLATQNEPLAPVPPSSKTVVVPFSFDGNLGTLAHGCVFPAGLCTSDLGVGTVAPDNTDLVLERPGANLTALSFNLSWQAGSPATQELWVGAMVMTSCEGCEDTSFQDAHGPSPVRVDVRDVSVALGQDAVVHIYVYNPGGFVYNDGVPAYAAVSVDEPFHIEGTATFVEPA